VKVTSDTDPKIREGYSELSVDPFKAFRMYFYKNEEQEQKGFDPTNFLVLPQHMVSATKGNYVFKVGDLNVKLTKKPYEPSHHNIERFM
jgi:hypothetical protein